MFCDSVAAPGNVKEKGGKKTNAFVPDLMMESNLGGTL